MKKPGSADYRKQEGGLDLKAERRKDEGRDQHPYGKGRLG